MKWISVGCAIVLAAVGCAQNRPPTAQSIPTHAASAQWTVGLLDIADRSDADLQRGLDGAERAIEITSENLSNANTTAYKARIPVLGPDGIEPRLDMAFGPIENTNMPLDVALQGDGFFEVKSLDSDDPQISYTRIGGFIVNNDSELVLGIGEGYDLVPPIKLPPGTTAGDVNIGQDGDICIARPGHPGMTLVGKFHLVNFRNPSRLKSLDDVFYTETKQSGPPVGADPASVVLLQNYLEGSNVDENRERLRLDQLETWKREMLDALEAHQKTR